MVIKVISSGQTGVDRAALDVALENDIACGGYCPPGRVTEDGRLDDKYPLVESDSVNYAQRSEANIRDSDGTLILSWKGMRGNTLKTAAIANRLKKPLLVVRMDEDPKVEEAETWAQKVYIKVLNVAGPAESEVPGAYEAAKVYLHKLLIG